MKKLCYAIALFMAAFSGHAQMNNAKLETLLLEKIDTIQGIQGRWEMTYQGIPLLLLTDETHDRMRIIAPIAEVKDISDIQLKEALVANFHSALDVKYAISNNIMWSIFVHPLGPLTEEQLYDAIEQVYFGAITFGTTYTSTPLIFGGGATEEKEKKPPLNKF